MIPYIGDFAAGATLYIPFHTFNSTGASVTISGLATSDIKIYKAGSVTQRSSTAGFTLLDTDGIDFDGITGVHGFSIDLSDNTDAGFYATAKDYWVVVDSITANANTVSFVAATFSIENRSALRPTVAGRTADVSAGGEVGVDWANVGSPTTAVDLSGTTIKTTQKVDVDTIKTNPVVNGGTITFPTTATLASTTNITAGTIATATNVTTVNGLAAGVITAASIAANAINDSKVDPDVTIASVTGAVGSVTGAVGSVTGAVGSVTGAVGSVTGNVGGNVNGSVGSVVGAVGSVTGLTAADVGAIKIQTDKLAFTVANQIDANIQYVNDVQVNGNGQTGTEWGP